MARKRGFLVQIQGVKSYRSKGRWYHYDRVTGQRLSAEPGTPEFLAEIQALRSVAREMALPRGTLGAVIGQFKASESYWDVLKLDTRLSYERSVQGARRHKDSANGGHDAISDYQSARRRT